MKFNFLCSVCWQLFDVLSFFLLVIVFYVIILINWRKIKYHTFSKSNIKMIDKSNNTPNRNRRPFTFLTISLYYLHPKDICVKTSKRITRIPFCLHTDQDNITYKGSLWSWSCSSWIYLCSRCLSPLLLSVQISIRANSTTLCDGVCRLLAAGRWYSHGPPVSSTNETDRHDIAEIFLKVALNTIKQISKHKLPSWICGSNITFLFFFVFKLFVL